MIQKIYQNKSLLGFIIALFFTALSLWIYLAFIEQDNYFLLDNPTEETVKVTLNKKEYILASYQSVAVSDLKEVNAIELWKKNELFSKDTFHFSKKIKRGVINPTHSTYVVYSNFYGISVNKDSLLKAHSYQLDSTTYVGKIRTHNSVFINDFYLNLDQNFPKILKKSDKISEIRKIFRKNQFIDFYNENFK